MARTLWRQCFPARLSAAGVHHRRSVIDSPVPSVATRASANPRIPYNAIPIHRTRWQVTASVAAASSPTAIVADFQTTAEALEFMSPFLLTGDPQRAQLIMTAIAAQFRRRPNLRGSSAQHWSDADPLNNSAVQSAGQAAIQAVAQVVVSETSPQTVSTYAAARKDAPRQTAALSSDTDSTTGSLAARQRFSLRLTVGSPRNLRRAPAAFSVWT